MHIGEIDFSNKKETKKMIEEHPLVLKWWDYIRQTGKTRTNPSDQMKQAYMSSLKFFMFFLSNGPKENQSLSLESLIELGQSRKTVEQLQSFIHDFFCWLRGETPINYTPKKTFNAWNSARNISYGCIRGFFTAFDVVWTRKFITPKIKKPAVRKTDRSSKNQLIKDKSLDYKKLDPFILKLDFRDQLILSCLLSSGIDIGDLLAMKKEDLEKIPEFEGRYIYEGSREKTAVEFTAIFSLRTTELLDVYLTEWRKDAEDSDPVFVSNKFNGIKSYSRKKRFGEEQEQEMETVEVSQEINTGTITTRFRQVALKLGYVKAGSKKQHAFRPKRFRKIFITLCEEYSVSNHAIKQMVGHKEDITEGYKELPNDKLLREYQKVEPFLDIFKSPSVIEHDKDLKLLKQENRALNFDIRDLKEKNKAMEERFAEYKVEVEELIKLYAEELHEHFVHDFNRRMDLIAKDSEETVKRMLKKTRPNMSEEEYRKLRKKIEQEIL